MAQQESNAQQLENQLLFVPIDAKMAKVLEEALNLLNKYPEIVRRIEADQAAHGKQQKLPRVQDNRRRADAHTPVLPRTTTCRRRQRAAL